MKLRKDTFVFAELLLTAGKLSICHFRQTNKQSIVTDNTHSDHMQNILNAIINISEGKDLHKINAIATTIKKIPHTYLLHIDSNASANRTVLSISSTTQHIVEACFAIIQKACNLIDMRTQQGEHLRIGSADVCPLVPIQNVSMEEAVQLADQLSTLVATELGLPVFNYEASAKIPTRKRLENCRRGQYENLAKRFTSGEVPDWGPPRFNKKNGAIVIGARKALIAYNINLDTTDIEIADAIAKTIRSSGGTIRVKGEKQQRTGLLKEVKAVGWFIREFGCCQVSTNLTDYTQTSIFEAFAVTAKVAESFNIKLKGSELIGLIPKQALLREGVPETKASLQQAVKELGLDYLQPFDLTKRVIEYRLKELIAAT